MISCFRVTFFFVCALGIVLFLPYNLQSQASLAHVYEQKAQEALDKNKRLEAVHYFKKAVAINPHHLPALVALGELLQEIQITDQALTYFKRAFAIEPRKKKIIINIIKTILDQGDIKEASKYIKIGEKLFPYDPDLLYLQALVYKQQGFDNIAKHTLKQVIVRNPILIRAHLTLGKIYLKEKHYKLAKQYFSKALRINPTNIESLVALAHLHMEETLSKQVSFLFENTITSNVFSKPLETLNNIIQYDPNNFTANLFLGKLYSLLGKCEKAKKYFKILLTLHPNHLESMYYLGFCSPKESLVLYPRLLDTIASNDIILFQLENNLLLHTTTRKHPSIVQYAKQHFRYSRHFSLNNQSDQALYELRWARYLFPSYLTLNKQLLQYYRLAKDFGNFKRTLNFLRENIDSIYYEDMYEQLLTEQKKQLFFNEQIFNVAHTKTDTPIFIFYFRPENPLPTFPDAGKAIAEKLSFALSQRGRVYLLPKYQRDMIYTSLTKKKYFGLGGYYNTEILPDVEKQFNGFLREKINGSKKQFSVGSNKLQYIISGSYQELPYGLHVKMDITDLVSGLSIYNTEVAIYGRNFLTNLSVSLAKKIYENIPFHGKILKVKDSSILINLGTQDGINAKDSKLFAILSDGKKVDLLLKKTGFYLSLVEPRNPVDYYRMQIGNLVYTK